MNVKLRIVVPALAAAVLAGCLAGPDDTKPKYDGIFKCDSSDLSSLKTEDDPASHAGAWSWEELAVRAGLRSDASKVAYIDAAVRRLRAEEELAWKDPELRLGYGWEDSDGSKHEDKARDWRDNGRSKGDGYSGSIGVRFYVPNPFVNRYIRARNNAEIRKEDARASVEAYEVYSEVKMLCYEAARAQGELEYLAKHVKAWDELRKTCDESFRSGVFKSPLDAIRAETKSMKGQIKYDQLLSEHSALIRQIAWLSGVPEKDLDVSATVPELPKVENLSVDRLTEIAFARRPDLAAAIAELEEAEAGVSAAKAAQLPWFRFVEASYQHGNDREDSYLKHKSDHDDEFRLKTSISLPVFTWAGKSVHLSKMVRERANARLQALYSSIREEIVSAYNDYRDASARVREEETGAFVERMEKRIEEYSASETAIAEEACKAREELIDYQNLQKITQMMKVEAALRLESVVGGPIPE